LNKTKLFVIGGFLGAGKTTSILSIARYLAAAGKKIAIVTNDQGSDLVDTNFLIKANLPVLEVTGGCFCCNFEEFTDKVNTLSENLIPDIILAEPVGSCTDLIATIFKPIKLNYTKQFSLGPLSIVVDPKRIKRLMMESYNSSSETASFPSEINYLFKKQIEEADVIILNKIDTLAQSEINSIIDFLKDNFHGVDVLSVSAKDSLGIDSWVSILNDLQFDLKPSLEIDYDTYAMAEEYLGWLNSSIILSSGITHNPMEFINSFMTGIKEKLLKDKMEIAHLKVYEVSEEDWAKASITSIYSEIDFSKTLDKPINKANLIINARINSTPEELEPVIMNSLEAACRKFNINIDYIDTQCFKPGKPNPVYRMD
jgi:G3E family GTPase